MGTSEPRSCAMDENLTNLEASSVESTLSTTRKIDVEQQGLETVMVSCPSQRGGINNENPRSWPTKKKIPIACFALLAGFVATIGTPIYIAGIPSIAIQFQVSTTLAILPACLYAWGLGIGGLLATAASEVFGRRIVYQISVPLTLVFTIVGGSTKTYNTLSIARFFAGFCAGPCLAVGSGVINDMWDVSLEKMGSTFVVLFGVLIIWATEIGPMASGSLVTQRSWRWTFWVVAMLLGIMTIVAFFISETYLPQIKRKQAKKEKNSIETRGALSHLFLVSVGRPLHMLLVEPLVFPSGLVVSVTQSVVFAYYVAYAVLFEEVYHFSQYHVGMAFAPLLVGAILAVPVLALFDKLTYQKAREYAIASGATVLPERRLYPAMLSVILFPISLFWLAWTGRPDIHWIVPTLSGVLFGLAYLLNMMCIPIYNNEVYSTHYGASVLAATTFMRFMMSSSFPLFTVQMVHSLGFHWAISLLGFVNIAMIPIPWIFFKWGPVLRSKSRYIKN